MLFKLVQVLVRDSVVPDSSSELCPSAHPPYRLVFSCKCIHLNQLDLQPERFRMLPIPSNGYLPWLGRRGYLLATQRPGDRILA
jgi:hypothetical protein